VSLVEDLAARVGRSWDLLAGDPGASIDVDAVEATIELLDRGEVRVAQPDGEGDWTVNAWAKQAVLLYFRVRGLETSEVGPFEYHDRLPLKHGFGAQGVRVVPPATVRWSLGWS
jgi:2,3,4,5-tetrahydropyridine-2-carboxylate N-succinyltransferase